MGFLEPINKLQDEENEHTNAIFRNELTRLLNYADPRRLEAGSKEFDKRELAVMHELLSFTLEKRLVTDHLTHFRREFVMPQKQMRIFLKHCGISYVSERGKMFSVFLTEALRRAGAD